MAEAVKLNIEKRDDSKNPRQLRAEGLIPGTVYGKGLDSISVQANEREFGNTYKKNAGANFEIDLDGKKYTVKVGNIQKNYRTNENLNIEFVVL